LDLPFEYRRYWADALISNKLILPKINCRFFTHIIQVEQTDEQWKHFSEGLMLKPEDLSMTSALDRYILAKPKPVPQEGEEEEAAGEEGEEKPQPLKEENLMQVKQREGSFSLI
jgi:adenylate/nucleoside-diphosphate kinase